MKDNCGVKPSWGYMGTGRKEVTSLISSLTAAEGSYSDSTQTDVQSHVEGVLMLMYQYTDGRSIKHNYAMCWWKSVSGRSRG